MSDNESNYIPESESELLLSPGFSYQSQSVLSNLLRMSMIRPPSIHSKKAIRFNEPEVHVQINENIDLILKKQDFLLKLSKALFMYGCPVYRCSYNMERTAEVLEVEASFVFMPEFIIVNFGDSELHTSETRFLKAMQGYEIGKLAKVNSLVKKVVDGNLDIDDAVARLNTILRSDVEWPRWIDVFCYMFASGAMSILAFNGKWIDMIASLLMGLCVGLLHLLRIHWKRFASMFEIIAAIVVSFSVRNLQLWIPNICFASVALSGIVWILPGLSITVSVLELASKHMMAGTVRVFYSLLQALMLAFGLEIGTALVFWNPSPLDAQCSDDGFAMWTRFWMFIPVGIVYSILLKARSSQILVMASATGIGYAVKNLMSLVLKDVNLATTASAFAIGICANLYSRVTQQLAIVPILNGVLTLVPGALGLRGVLAVLRKDDLIGAEFAMELVIICLSITVGLFLAFIIVYPIPQKKRMDFSL